MSDMLEGIHAVLAATPLRWAQLIETIPEDLLQRRPVASAWSMAECLQHMIATEQLFAARLEALRQEQDIPAADPTKFEGPIGETPTARMLISSLVQYNAGGNSLSASIRLRWEYTGGSELFVVYSDGRNTLTSGYPDLLNRTFAIKATRLLRF